MTTATTHTTRVRSFSAAGDRAFVPWCDTCARNVGSQTTDRTRAQTDADAHTLAPIRGRI